MAGIEEEQLPTEAAEAQSKSLSQLICEEIVAAIEKDTKRTVTEHRVLARSLSIKMQLYDWYLAKKYLPVGEQSQLPIDHQSLPRPDSTRASTESLQQEALRRKIGFSVLIEEKCKEFNSNLERDLQRLSSLSTEEAYVEVAQLRKKIAELIKAGSTVFVDESLISQMEEQAKRVQAFHEDLEIKLINLVYKYDFSDMAPSSGKSKEAEAKKAALGKINGFKPYNECYLWMCRARAFNDFFKKQCAEYTARLQQIREVSLEDFRTLYNLQKEITVVHQFSSIYASMQKVSASPLLHSDDERAQTAFDTLVEAKGYLTERHKEIVGNPVDPTDKIESQLCQGIREELTLLEEIYALSRSHYRQIREDFKRHQAILQEQAEVLQRHLDTCTQEINRQCDAIDQRLETIKRWPVAEAFPETRRLRGEIEGLLKLSPPRHPVAIRLQQQAERVRELRKELLVPREDVPLMAESQIASAAPPSRPQLPETNPFADDDEIADASVMPMVGADRAVPFSDNPFAPAAETVHIPVTPILPPSRAVAEPSIAPPQDPVPLVTVSEAATPQTLSLGARFIAWICSIGRAIKEKWYAVMEKLFSKDDKINLDQYRTTPIIGRGRSSSQSDILPRINSQDRTQVSSLAQLAAVALGGENSSPSSSPRAPLTGGWSLGETRSGIAAASPAVVNTVLSESNTPMIVVQS